MKTSGKVSWMRWHVQKAIKDEKRIRSEGSMKKITKGRKLGVYLKV